MSIFAQLEHYCGGSVIPRELTYKGKTETFYFRDLGADEAEDFFSQFDAEKKTKHLRSKIIAKILCTKDGGDAITEAEAGKLATAFATDLQAVCFEVNGIGDKAEADAKKG